MSWNPNEESEPLDEEFWDEPLETCDDCGATLYPSDDFFSTGLCDRCFWLWGDGEG